MCVSVCAPTAECYAIPPVSAPSAPFRMVPAPSILARSGPFYPGLFRPVPSRPVPAPSIPARPGPFHPGPFRPLLSRPVLACSGPFRPGPFPTVPSQPRADLRGSSPGEPSQPIWRLVFSAAAAVPSDPSARRPRPPGSHLLTLLLSLPSISPYLPLPVIKITERNKEKNNTKSSLSCLLLLLLCFLPRKLNLTRKKKINPPVS